MPKPHTLPYPYLWPSTMGCSSCSRVCLLPQQLRALTAYSCPGKGSQVAGLEACTQPMEIGKAIPAAVLMARLP